MEIKNISEILKVIPITFIVAMIAGIFNFFKYRSGVDIDPSSKGNNQLLGDALQGPRLDFFKYTKIKFLYNQNLSTIYARLWSVGQRKTHQKTVAAAYILLVILALVMGVFAYVQIGLSSTIAYILAFFAMEIFVVYICIKRKFSSISLHFETRQAAKKFMNDEKISNRPNLNSFVEYVNKMSRLKKLWTYTQAAFFPTAVFAFSGLLSSIFALFKLGLSEEADKASLQILVIFALYVVFMIAFLMHSISGGGSVIKKAKEFYDSE